MIVSVRELQPTMEHHAILYHRIFHCHLMRIQRHDTNCTVTSLCEKMVVIRMTKMKIGHVWYDLHWSVNAIQFVVCALETANYKKQYLHHRNIHSNFIFKLIFEMNAILDFFRSLYRCARSSDWGDRLPISIDKK